MSDLTVLLDLDNTGVDFLGPICKMLTKMRQMKNPGCPEVTPLDFVDWGMEEGFTEHEQKEIHALWRTPGYFLNLAPHPGFIQAVKDIKELGADPVIVTHATTSQSIGEKAAWVEKHLDFLGPSGLITAKDKWRIAGDVFVDDSPEQVNNRFLEHPDNVIIVPRYKFNEDNFLSKTAASLLPFDGSFYFGNEEMFWVEVVWKIEDLLIEQDKRIL